MTLAADSIDRCGPSNEMHRQLQSKKTKVRLYQPLIQQQKVFHPMYITKKMEHISFKSGHVEWMTKDLKGNWLVVLR